MRAALRECLIVGAMAAALLGILAAGVTWPGLVGPLIIAGTIGQKWEWDDE